MAIGDNGNSVPAEVSGRRTSSLAADPTRSAFFWLSAFFVVYCTRVEDFVPGFKYVPLGKITAIMAMYGFFTAMGKTKRTLKDAPKESRLLLYMIGLLYLGAFLSPIWRGGALLRCVDFSKIYIVWLLVFLLITTFDRLRKIIFIQAFSVVIVCVAAIVKGYDVPRLNQVLGGFYSNPNDLAFAEVLSLPFALAFTVTAKNALIKTFWACGRIWHTVHMTYLPICAEGGILVLILYLMFFWRGFMNLRALHRKKNLDPDIVLFIGALQASLIGFVVGALFAPEAYQFFPYFAVAFTATLLQTIKEQEQGPSTPQPPPKKPRHFLEVYADHRTTGAVTPVR